MMASIEAMLKLHQEKMIAANTEIEILKADLIEINERLASNICGYCWENMYSDGYPTPTEKIEKLKAALEDISMFIGSNGFPSKEAEIAAKILKEIQ